MNKWDQWNRRNRCASSDRAFTLVEMVVAIGIIVILAVLTVTAAGMLSTRSEVRQTESVIKLLDMALQEWETGADRKLSWGENDSPYAGAKYDLEIGTPHVYTVTEVLRRIRNSGQVRPILAQIDPDFLYTYNTSEQAPAWITPGIPGDPDIVINGANPESIYTSNDLSGTELNGELTVLDAWDNPIRVVHPGRVADFNVFGDDPSNPDETDRDGTVYVDDTTPAVGTKDFYQTELFYGRAEGRRVRFVSAGPDGRFGNLDAQDGTPDHEAAHDNVYSYPVEDDHG